MNFLWIASGAVFVGGVIGVLVCLPDIRRYLPIKKM